MTTVDFSPVKTVNQSQNNNEPINSDTIGARGCNPSNENNNDPITENVKKWIIIPTIIFGVMGFGILIVLLILLISNMINNIHEHVLAAFILAFAGMPSVFLYNIKNIRSAITGE